MQKVVLTRKLLERFPKDEEDGSARSIPQTEDGLALIVQPIPDEGFGQALNGIVEILFKECLDDQS